MILSHLRFEVHKKTLLTVFIIIAKANFEELVKNNDALGPIIFGGM